MQQIVQGLSAVLFPTHYGRLDLSDDSIDYFVGNILNSTLVALAEQIRRGLLFVTDADAVNDANLTVKAGELTQNFAAQPPAIRALLVSDLQSAYQGDPAASSASEILLCSRATTVWLMLYTSLAHRCWPA